MAHAMAEPFTKTCISPTRIVWQPSGVTVPAGSALMLAGDSGGLILDFAFEVFGGVHISIGQVHGSDSATLRIRFGESVPEVAGRRSFAEWQDSLRSGASIDVGNFGFRFVRLEILEAGVTAEVQKIQAVAIQRKLEYQGSFRCSDDRLNEIWQVGARTVHLCMQTELWDGIKRGQTVWIGDLYPSAMVVSTVFGAQSIVTESLDQVRNLTLHGDSEEISWMNGISEYSLWWILIQHRWYLYHGDREYLEQQRTYLARLLAKLFASVDRSGCERLDGWRFLDWATEDEEDDIHAGFQSLFILALQAATALCEWLGENRWAAKCRKCISRLKRCIPHAGPSKQAHALMVLAGFEEPIRTNREVLAGHQLAAPMAAVDPSAGLTPAVNQMTGLTPFMAYPVLEARALAGDDVGCLDLIRGYWGAMLDMGATAFWEDFDASWVENSARIDELALDKRQFPIGFGRCSSGVAMSLCHGWSCGVTAWLSNHVLGVRPKSPGCRVIEVDPHLGRLAWAEGTFPTPFGNVRVRHVQNSDASVSSTIEGPQGVEIARSS